eukprot:jgi/Bigna1/68762/fgenesh1_pg.7_\
MTDLIRNLELSAKALSFLVIAFFFGGGINLVLYLRIDDRTGLGLEEALFLLLAFLVYSIFAGLTYICGGDSYTDRPEAIFEMSNIRISETKFQGPRFHNLAERTTKNGNTINSRNSSHPPSRDTKSGSQISAKRPKKERKKQKKRKKLDSRTASSGGASRNSESSNHYSLEYFNLAYVMKAGLRGHRQVSPRGDSMQMAMNTQMERRFKFHIFNLLAVMIPFLIMMVPLVPCWQRDSHGLRCSASGSPSAVFILVWNCLVSFLLGLHYAGMLLTTGTLLSHCEGMARVMRDLVVKIEAIDELEAWHTTMWRLHRHMYKKIKPFKALILGSMVFGVLFTLAAVSLSIAHFSVSSAENSDEMKELEAAWIQSLMCAFIFSVPGIFIFAFAAQVNSILSKAVDRLDSTGGGQEISLAEYYSTVIGYWKKKRKGFIFCGIHISDLTCFYFTVGLGMIALIPVIYAGSF